MDRVPGTGFCQVILGGARAATTSWAMLLDPLCGDQPKHLGPLSDNGSNRYTTQIYMENSHKSELGFREEAQ